ncbi:hypothetical protein ACFSTC_07040 [Nonomuraea ferruginea]
MEISSGIDSPALGISLATCSANSAALGRFAGLRWKAPLSSGWSGPGAALTSALPAVML